MTDDLLSDIVIPPAPGNLASLRAAIASLPTPLAASVASSRSGATPFEVETATDEMAVPLTPQPESFIITNPTTSKTNLLADPSWDRVDAANPVLLGNSGSYVPITDEWKGAVVVSSGTLPATAIRFGKLFERGSASNPFNSAAVYLDCLDATTNAWTADIYVAPAVDLDPGSQDPINDFLVGQGVIWQRNSLASYFAVATCSLQLIKNPGGSEVVVDESPLYDLLAGSTGGIQYLVASAANPSPDFRTGIWQWRLRFHLEKTAAVTISTTLGCFAEPCLSFGSSPDPVTYAPYIGRWDPYRLVGTDLLLMPFWSSSGKGWEILGTDDGDADLQFRKYGDSSYGPRLLVGYDNAEGGIVAWGPGAPVGNSAGPDVAFKRNAPGEVMLFDWGANPSPDVSLIIRAATGKVPMLEFAVGSTIDVNLYRENANVLATDDQFNAGTTIAVKGAGSLRLHLGYSGSAIFDGIAFGSAYDTNLYRSAAHDLRTDDHFFAAELAVPVKAGAPSDSDTAVDMSGNVILDTTNSRIYFRVDSTWKYAQLT